MNNQLQQALEALKTRQFWIEDDEYAGPHTFVELSDVLAALSSQPERTNELIELLAADEHQRWSDQAKKALYEMTDERRTRWETLVKTPYSELSEEMKELDREQVRKRVWAISHLADVPREVVSREAIVEFLREVAVNAYEQGANSMASPVNGFVPDTDSDTINSVADRLLTSFQLPAPQDKRERDDALKALSMMMSAFPIPPDQDDGTGRRTFSDDSAIVLGYKMGRDVFARIEQGGDGKL